MIYYWAIFLLLVALVVHNARRAVADYSKNKKLAALGLHAVLLTAFVGIVMHSVWKVFTVLEVHFRGLTRIE